MQADLESSARHPDARRKNSERRAHGGEAVLEWERPWKNRGKCPRKPILPATQSANRFMPVQVFDRVILLSPPDRITPLLLVGMTLAHSRCIGLPMEFDGK